MLEGGPPELQEVSQFVIGYVAATAHERKFELFGKNVIPYPRADERFWWAVLLNVRPARSFKGGEQPLIDGPDVNASGSPREQCALMREQLEADGCWDVPWMFDPAAPEKEVQIVQIECTSNFLDRRAYTKKTMAQWKFAEYAYSNNLVLHKSEVPAFLDYRLAVFANTAAKCVRMQHKIELRNSPANLLTIDKRSLEAPVDIHGKAFVVAEGRDLDPLEVFEIVIFCMGQAETTELKLTSWDRLREVLTEEARKFMMSAQHVRGRPRLRA